MSSIFVVDGMKRPAFPVNIDVEGSTLADLFREVARSYTLELDPIKNLRIIFADKELKYTGKIKLRKVGIINNSTIGVIFRLPDRHPMAPATTTTTEDADVVESVEAEIDGKNKDAEEVSLDIESVSADEEHKEVKNVPAAESMPVKAKKKIKKKKPKNAIIKEIPPVLEDAFDSISVTTDDKENKETGDAPAAESEPVKAKRKRIRNKKKPGKEEEIRPILQNLPEILALTFEPDFLDFDETVCRARLPCSHVMGSETMRAYCQNLINTGSTIFPCPYTLPVSPGSLFLVSPSNCPAVWEYRHVRHVACFTIKEMKNTEKTIAINFMGLESSILTCPGCFTWCSKADAKQTRLRCFTCTREHGMEFLFCGYCLSKWRNTRSGRCANAECKSIEATLDTLRNSAMTYLNGAVSPTTRLCPRCGILTEFIGGCSQVHCQVCGYYYCFLCLKGAKSKAQLQCRPYFSFCQSAAVQTSIPEWDGFYNE